MRIIFLGILSILFCVACSEQHDHKGKTPLVELDGNFLYQEDLQSALPARLSKDDSLLFAEHYIRNWVEDILLYEKAQSNIPDNGEIEKLVENYRKALIMHTYQQALIHQRLSNEISEGELTDYYEKNKAAVAKFMEEYENSVDFVNSNVDTAAEYVEKFGIFKAAVAKKAIPYCNITFIKSNEMKTRINQYLTILYESNPSSVGGSMPDDNFYAE